MHPVLFTIGEVPVYSFGVAMLASVVIACVLLLKAAHALKVSPNTAILVGLFMVAGAVLGGRLGFLAVNWRQGVSLSTLFGFGGESVFVTAMLGAIIALAFSARWIRRPLWTTLDLITPAIVGAWAISNAGCFLAGCCVGNPTDGPLGLSFFADTTPPELKGVKVHPVQLYKLVVQGAVVALWFVWSRAAPGARFFGAVAVLLMMRVGFTVSGVAGSISVATIAGYTALAAIAGMVVLLVSRKSAPLAEPLSARRREKRVSEVSPSPRPSPRCAGRKGLARSAPLPDPLPAAQGEAED